MAKCKISDEQIIEQIGKGLNNKQILDHFDMVCSSCAGGKADEK